MRPESDYLAKDRDKNTDLWVIIVVQEWFICRDTSHSVVPGPERNLTVCLSGEAPKHLPITLLAQFWDDESWSRQAFVYVHYGG